MSTRTLDSKEQQKRFILHGNLWKVMASLSWPAVIAMVLYGANAMLDAFFVGQYVGETALAGVSLAYPITQISMGMTVLLVKKEFKSLKSRTAK